MKGLMVVLIGTSLLTCAAGMRLFVPLPVRSEITPYYTTLEYRLDKVKQGLDGVEAYYEDYIAPVERIIATRNKKDARQIAWAVVRNADRHKLPVDFVLGLLLVENPDFALRARSSVGAVGLAQIMPLHAGQWGCGRDLEDPFINICTGLNIYKANLRDTGNKRMALLRYNGCVRGTNTPDCHRYPDWVNNKTQWVRKRLHVYND